MSTALKIPDAAPTHESVPRPLKLSASELKLRGQFVAAFNDIQPGLALNIAVRDVTDELKRAGELPEEVVKRIKYVAALPITFHYRVGYKPHNARLAETVSKAISLAVERYFNELQT